MPKPRIVVVLDGGLVQYVQTDGLPDEVDLFVVDYDTEGADEADLVDIPQDPQGKETKQAFLTWENIVENPVAVEQVSFAFDQKWGKE